MTMNILPSLVIDRGKSMPLLCKGPGKLKLYATPLRDRMEQSYTLSIYLLIVEIILSGELQRYSWHVFKYIRENGLYRQQMKKQVNELLRLTNELQNRCNTTDATVMIEHIIEIMPAYGKSYIEEGGGTVARFQNAFSVQNEDITHEIFKCNKQITDKVCTVHSELCAHLLTLQAIAQTGVEAYNIIAKQQDMLVFGEVILHRQKSRHHECVIRQCELLSGPYLKAQDIVNQCPELLRDSRELIRHMQMMISGESLDSTTIRVFQSVVMEYIEFVLASMCMDVHATGSFPKKVEAVLLERSNGDTDFVNRLLGELKELPISEDVDAWDFAHEFPEGGVGSAIARFRQMCFERHQMAGEVHKEYVKFN